MRSLQWLLTAKTLAFALSLAPLQSLMVAFALAAAVAVLAQRFDAVINAVVGFFPKFSLNFPRYQPFRFVFAVCLGGTASRIRQGLYVGTINGFAVRSCLGQTVFVDIQADNVGDADDVS